jgi:hypothetical protein
MEGAIADGDAFYDEDFYYDAPEPRKGNMLDITLNIARLNAAQLAGKLELNLQAITADPTTFTGATTLLTEGNQVEAELVAADAAVELLVTQTAEARALRDQKYQSAVDFYVAELVPYVLGIAKGDEAVVIAAGLQPARPRGPSPAMTQVLNVRLTAGIDDGTANAVWDPMYRSRTYEVQLSSDPMQPNNWVTHDLVTTTSLTLTGQPSGQKRWLRVRAINNVNKGPWSDPACITIP